MSQRSIRRLNNLQNWFIRLILKTGPGTPNPALLWDLRMLDMELRVWREKLVLAHHLLSLGRETIGRQMFEEQLAKRWPGLALEVEEICSKLNLPKLDSCWLDAKNFRKLVTSACHSENEKRLRKISENIKKCKNIQEEKYGKQNYVLKEKLQVARNIFKTRYGMTEFAANFKNNLKYKKNNWMCFCQEEKESEDHLLRGNCKVYSDLLEKKTILVMTKAQ